MAKEQDLPLNSSKISGVCGRLMCCLRYEFEAYKDFKSRAPKKKTLIDTPLGKARIQEYDTPREQLVLRLENGKVFKVNLADMTCSEGCKKKAAEQGCNCRPDCVTRDVLERIESPEMRLALMELDRENGVDVGDGLSSADRLAGTSMPKRRRRDAESDARAAQGQGEGRGRGKGRGKTEAPEAEETAGGRRRRKRAASVDNGEAAGKNASRERETQQPQQQNRGGGMNPTRRRRRHLSSEEREDAFRAAAAREAGAAPKDASGSDAPADKGGKPRGEEERAPRPRRRHSSGAQQKPSVPSVADQVSDGEVKVTRRRPGDGGGAAAKASRGGTRDEREPRENSGGEGSTDQGQKRRRRRRSRKPRQDGGEGSTHTSSAPQPPAGE